MNRFDACIAMAMHNKVSADRFIKIKDKFEEISEDIATSAILGEILDKLYHSTLTGGDKSLAIFMENCINIGILFSLQYELAQNKFEDSKDNDNN